MKDTIYFILFYLVIQVDLDYSMNESHAQDIGLFTNTLLLIIVIFYMFIFLCIVKEELTLNFRISTGKKEKENVALGLVRYKDLERRQISFTIPR